MINISGQCRRLLLSLVYRNQCICRLASVTSECCYPRTGEIESQISWPHKSSMQKDIKNESVLLADNKLCSGVGFDYCPPRGGIQSSVTKFRFEDNQPVEICEEWYYTVHYLKSVVHDVEESLSNLDISSTQEDADSLKWYARPYHFTVDDIVDMRRLQSPDHDTFSRSTVVYPGKTHDLHVQKYCGKSDVTIDRFQSPVGSSLDKFLAFTALAVCNIIQFRCDCSMSRELLQHGGPAKLLPYLDEKTFYGGLLTELGQPCDSYILHYDNVSRQLILDSFGLMRHPQLLTNGTSSDLTPGGDGDKQKLPNVDQLRAIQDNLAYNMPKLFTSGHEYSIYTEDVEFDNRWFPGCTYTTRGQMMYSLEVARLRLFIHMRLANVRIQLLKTTAHPEDGTVRVRWRVIGIPISHAVKFWKFLPWTKRRTGTDNTEWMDGFSTFYVGEHGLVYKHKMDRIIPDDGVQVNTKKGVIEKLVGMTSPAATT